MSRIHNPFDSSDDEPNSPVKSSSKAAINPFDDDANFKPTARAFNHHKVSHHDVSGAPNPFEDDDDDNKHDLHKPSWKQQSQPSQNKGLPDEDDDHFHVKNLSKPSEGKERSRNHFKDRISASGDTALRRVQKMKDASATHASKLVDGSATQVHKMKESTYNTLKPSNGQASTKKGSSDLKSGLGNDGVRDELFEGTSVAKPARMRYDDSQFQKQDLEYKSMDELEGYALQKAEDTTSTVQNCLRVAEEIKSDATRTLLTLNEQGEQITKTHEIALDIDHNLSRGEKLLGNLGGMFSKTWKPKKSRPITGPAISKSDSFKRRGHHLEQRVALGLTKTKSRGRENRIVPSANLQQTTHNKLEGEKAKQDDALAAISNVLDDLKIMSQDMGSEIASQNVALDGVDTDVGTLKDRVQDANYRARRLIRR